MVGLSTGNGNEVFGIWNEGMECGQWEVVNCFCIFGARPVIETVSFVLVS